MEWFIRIHLLQRFVFYNSFLPIHLLHEVYKVEDCKPYLNKKSDEFLLFQPDEENLFFCF